MSSTLCQLPLAPQSDLSPVTRVLRRNSATIIWLHGDQDMATVEALSDVLSAEGALSSANVVVDLSEITFLDASTLGVFVSARNALSGRPGSFSLRAPPPCAVRLLDLCGLNGLLESSSNGTATSIGHGGVQARQPLLVDHERFATIMNDGIIRRIFAGLALHAAAQLSTEPTVIERLGQVVDGLDDTIRHIREALLAAVAS